MFEKLYDENETAKVRFIGFTTNDTRYDFGIVYTSMFFGKPLVICMQTNRVTLLGPDDIENTQHLRDIFRLRSSEEAEDLAQFLKFLVPAAPLHVEYE
ncbi:DUF3055 domain-containing protein [Ectobacillus panaciterrae]|uniref:DUF3055 domain-containing protein n=1 Tax=Ectobacillus panaciterrae TaxID=363872 RepID=UPI0004197D04|nr:DUF3055 domain-containing protein [Ectobacillus panaciterrae]